MRQSNRRFCNLVDLGSPREFKNTEEIDDTMKINYTSSTESDDSAAFLFQRVRNGNRRRYRALLSLISTMTLIATAVAVISVTVKKMTRSEVDENSSSQGSDGFWWDRNTLAPGESPALEPGESLAPTEEGREPLFTRPPVYDDISVTAPPAVTPAPQLQQQQVGPEDYQNNAPSTLEPLFYFPPISVQRTPPPTTTEPSSAPSQPYVDPLAKRPSYLDLTVPPIPPTSKPTGQPTETPTRTPTAMPTAKPTPEPSKTLEMPVARPTLAPFSPFLDIVFGDDNDDVVLYNAPSEVPSSNNNAPVSSKLMPTIHPTQEINQRPTRTPRTMRPTFNPDTEAPTEMPTDADKPITSTLSPTFPTLRPSPEDDTERPTRTPRTMRPTRNPTTEEPTEMPTETDTEEDTEAPVILLTLEPKPTDFPNTPRPTRKPTTDEPITDEPTKEPKTEEPTVKPTEEPTDEPTAAPVEDPTAPPTKGPTEAPVPDPSPFPTTGPPTRKPTPEATPKPTQGTPDNEQQQQQEVQVVVNGLTYRPGDLTEMQAGLKLSTGLQARILATTGEKVTYHNGEQSEASFHGRPDAGATFVDTRPFNPGGWVYVSNSEMRTQDPPGGPRNGGVGAITFDSKGNVLNYKMILSETTWNCGGGRTPWNTWVSCEEAPTGVIWQVDPMGVKETKQLTMGSHGGRWESFTYDISDMKAPHFFVTEDHRKGALIRFTPSPEEIDWQNPWGMLHGNGTTDYLELTPNKEGTGGSYKWIPNYEQARENAAQYMPNCEGIDRNGDSIYFVSKQFLQMFELNLKDMTYTNISTVRGLFDGRPDQIARILETGNEVQHDDDILYFTEEGGVDAGVHGRGPDGRFFTILESPEYKDETSGLAFSPDAMHMYIAYQENGVLLDVTRQDGLAFHARSLNVKYHATG